MAKAFPDGSVEGLCSAAATVASLGLAFFGVWGYTNATTDDTWEYRELWVIVPVLLSFLSLASTTLFATWPYDKDCLLKAGKLPWSMRVARISFLLGTVLAGFAFIMVLWLDWRVMYPPH
jgi:hypothetical protein